MTATKVMDSPHEINPAGFTIHSAIHAAREDAKCVLHVHSVNGAAVSAQKDGVLPISQQSIFVLSSLAYHDYEGVALREDEKPRLVRDLGDKQFFMLRNHGLITVADNVPDAFLLHVHVRIRLHDSSARASRRRGADPDRSAHHRNRAAAGRDSDEFGRSARSRGLRCCASLTGSTRPIEAEPKLVCRAMASATAGRPGCRSRPLS